MRGAMRSFVMGTTGLMIAATVIGRPIGECSEGFPSVGLPGYPDGEVRSMAVFNDGTGPLLYIGGTFQEVDGQIARSMMARSIGGTFVPFGESSTVSPMAAAVNSLVTGPLPNGAGQALYIGGIIPSIGGITPTNNIAVYNDQGQWLTIPGNLSGGSGQGIKSLAVINNPNLKEPTLLVVAGDFTAVESSPTPGLAYWDGFGSLSALPSPPGSDQLLSLQGVKAIDLDGPTGPNPPVVAIFGAARTMPQGLSTSAVRIFDGSVYRELGPRMGAVGWLRGTVRDMTAGDPDGPGPQPWTIFAVGSNLLGGGELLAYYDAASEIWQPLNAPYTGEGAAPTILDSVAAVPVDTQEHLFLVTASKFGGGRVLYYVPFFGDFYNVQDLPGTISVIRNLPQAVPSGTPAAFVGGDFSAPVQTDAFVENYAPYGAENIAQIPIFSDPFNNAIYPAQANTAAVPPLPAAEFTSDAGFTALGAVDLDGAGPEPTRLVAQVRFDPKSGDSPRLGSTSVGSELVRWNGSTWTPIPGAFDDNGTIVELTSIIQHDFDGPGPVAPSVVVTGEFQTVDSVPVPNIAYFDGSLWQPLTNLGIPLGPVINEAVSGAVENIGGGEQLLIVGGQLTTNGQFGGPPTSGVAVWVNNSLEWWFLDSQNLGTNPVRALAIYDPDGSGTKYSPELYAASTSGTLRWGGGGPFTGPVIPGSWDAITPGLGNGTQSMLVYDVDGDGGLNPFLAFIGRYPGIPDGGGNDSRVVFYNGALGSRAPVEGFPWLQGMNAQVLITPSGTRRLAVGGFGTIPSEPSPYASGVAITDGSPEPGWSIIASSDTPNDFRMVAVDDDGAGPNPNSLVIASGNTNAGFGVLPPVSVQQIARFEPASPGLWTRAGGGDFSDFSNYNCSLLPGASDRLTFDNTTLNPGLDVRTVTLTDSPLIAGIRNLADSNTIDLAGNTLFLVPADPVSQPALVVGDGPTAPTLLGFASSAGFGFADSVFGKILIATRDVGSFVDQRLYVGSNTQLNADSIDVGVAGRGGHLEVNSQVPGQISTLGVFAGFRVGIEPASEAQVTVQGIPGATQATINPNGAGPIHIGVGGNGFMGIFPGGRFVGAATDFAIAVQPASTGFVLQSNSNNLFILSSPTFSIGRGGLGGYEVEGGANATFNDGNIILGELPTGTGTITVRGVGSTLTHNQAGGNVAVGAAGTGDLRVLDRGEFITSGTVTVGPRGAIRGNGVVRATGGILNNGTISPSSALSIPGEDVPGSIGALNLDGQFTQSDAGTTIIEIDAPPGGPLTSDRLTVSGPSTLAGRLDVRFTPGSILPPGGLIDGIEVFYSDQAISGAFDVATFPGLPPDIITGRGRFLRFEVGQIPGRAGVPFSVRIIEGTLESIIESTPPSEYDIGGAGTAAALGDLDNDGDRDLVITVPDSASPTGNPGSIIILYNAGTINGYWQGFSSTTQILVRRNPSGVSLGDFDGVNGLDIAVVHGTDNDLVVLTNNGDGVFLPPLRGTIPPIPVGPGPNAVDSRDFDGDGRTDAVVSVGGANSLKVFYNAGGTGDDWGGFSASEEIIIVGSPAGTTPVDLDDDKFDDISSPQPNSGTISNNANRGGGVLRGPGDQFGEPVVIFVGGEPVDIAAGDLNLDGFQDLVVALKSADELAILLGNGTATMTPPTYIPAGDGPTSVALARLDSDNDLDIAVVTSNEQGQRVVRVIRNDLFGGDLNFAFQADLFPGSAPTLVLGGDVTGDQADDLVTVNDGGVVNLRGLSGDGTDVSVFTFASCTGDANNDRRVGMDDIVATLANWMNVYSPSTGPGDADGNGRVEFADITSALGFYGRTCN